MRLPNGYGAIIKLAGKRRRPFAARITAGYDESGKQKYRYLGYFKKRSDALACLKEYNDNPYNLDLTRLTFSEIYNRWKEWRLSNGSQTVYNSAYTNFSELKDDLFIGLKTNKYQSIIDSTNLSYSSKNNMKTLISHLYKYAQMVDIPVKNYAKFISVRCDSISTIHKPFSDDELKELWKHKNQKNVQIILIYIYTGLRPKELLDIKTENVFLDKKYMIGGIKTLAGKNRVIPIADKILPFVSALYNKENKYLIMTAGNKKLSYSGFRTLYWKGSIVNNHLPHDCRHTCATLLANADIDKKTIQLILGHSTGDITERVYIHKTIEQLIKAVNSI